MKVFSPIVYALAIFPAAGRHAGRESFKDIPREPKANKVTDEVSCPFLR